MSFSATERIAPECHDSHHNEVTFTIRTITLNLFHTNFYSLPKGKQVTRYYSSVSLDLLKPNGTARRKHLYPRSSLIRRCNRADRSTRSMIERHSLASRRVLFQDGELSRNARDTGPLIFAFRNPRIRAKRETPFLTLFLGAATEPERAACRGGERRYVRGPLSVGA